MLFLRLRRGIQKRCKWQSHARPQDTPQHTSPRQQSAATIFHSIFLLMLTDVWTGESVARGQMYNWFTSCCTVLRLGAGARLSTASHNWPKKVLNRSKRERVGHRCVSR